LNEKPMSVLRLVASARASQSDSVSADVAARTRSVAIIWPNDGAAMAARIGDDRQHGDHLDQREAACRAAAPTGGGRSLGTHHWPQ
jgi:hypothetical protein